MRRSEISRGILGATALVALPLLLPMTVEGQSPIRWQARPAPGLGTVTIFADGNAGAVLTDDKDGTAGSGSGAVGARLDTENWAFRVQINAATSADSVTQAYGSFVLNPALGTSSGSLDVLWFRDDAGRHALHGNAVFGRTEWVRPADDTLPRLSSGASLWGVSVTYLFSIPATADGETYSVQFYGGVQHRGMGGDISDEPVLRLATLNTDEKSFWGFLFGTDVSLRNLTAGIRGSWLGRRDEAQIDGLTGIQLSFIVNLNADVVSFPVTRIGA